MEIKIVSKNGSIPEDVQELIKNKVSRLPRFFERTTGIQVVAHLHTPDQPHVEIKISAEHCEDFFASDKGANVLTAVENTVQKIEQQMRKQKEKMTDHHRGREENQDV